jgi:hypothetical protein
MRALFFCCRFCVVAIVASVVLAASPNVLASSPDDPHPSWTRSGSILQWAIPAAGLGLTFLLTPDRGVAAVPTDTFGVLAGNDAAAGLNWPGPRLNESVRRDFAIAFVRMEVVTYALKYGINEERPHHGGGQSLPSGHTSASFMGAEFIRKNYGWAWGTPALLAATWVGYTRVQSHNHFWWDVVAGAAIGVLSNYDFDEVHMRDSTLHVAPGLIAQQGYTSARDDTLSTRLIDDRRVVPGIELEWRFGSAR